MMKIRSFPEAKILVVDDEKVNILLLEKVLDAEGYSNVASTTDSREVLEIFGSFQPDLIILDLSMPFMNGLEVMQQLRMHRGSSHVPILILTADATSATKKRALEAGATDFLTKPFDNEEVLLRTRNLLDMRVNRLLLESQLSQSRSEIARLQSEITTATEKIETAQLARKSLLSGISYELRTPLNSIIGMTSLLMQRPSSAEEYIGLSAVSESSSRLLDTIDQILVSEAEDANSFKDIVSRVEVSEAVSKVVSLFRAEAHLSGISLILREQMESEVFVKVNTKLFNRALSLLIGNAVRFTRKGTVSVEWHTELNSINSVVSIVISDDGPSVSQVALDEILKQSDFVSARGPSCVLKSDVGLAMAGNLAQSLGGTLHIQSKQNSPQGICLRIPVETIERPLVSIDQHNSSPCVKVLIVDNNLVNAMVAKELLSRASCQVTVTDNGLDAIDLRFSAEFDIVLMNIQLPGCDGLEATLRIRKSERIFGLPPVCILAVAANVRSEDIARYESVGMDGLLPKPVNGKSLQAAISGIFERLSI